MAFDREQTIRRFKKGEQAYRETALGGCVKVGECDEIPLKWLDIECLSRGCANLVWKVSKLDRVIAALTRHVGSLKPGSQEFLNEKGELDILISAREKAIHQQSSQEAA